MSLSYEYLDTVLVRDPVTEITNKREYAVLKGGQQVSYKQYSTTSVSSTAINWSCPPPSASTIIDRKIWIYLPVRLTFAGDAGVGNLLLNPGTDGPRAYPISGSISTLSLTINNTSMSINMADVVHPMSHYNNDVYLQRKEYSLSPVYPDQSQVYSSLYQTNRNPLGAYGDSNNASTPLRGAFPFTVVSNTQTTAVVDIALCEPIFLSPLYWGQSNEGGLYNVNTMDFTFNFLNTGNRMWSHDATSGVASSITSVSASFTTSALANSQPLLFFRYITPGAIEGLDLSPEKAITYPYSDITRYPTDFSQQNAGVTSILTSNNLQLSSIPTKMFLLVRERNADLQATTHNTDTYFGIENISLQWGNKSGLLSSCSKRSLYEMSVKNGCNMSWNEWSGDSVQANGVFGSAYGTVGSVLALEFASDIGLDYDEAPGKLGQYSLQVQVTAKNVSSRNIIPTLWMIIVSEGTFTIQNLGSASVNVGVISSEDIINAEPQPGVTYSDVVGHMGGGFNLGKSLKKAYNFYKKERRDLGREILPFAKVAADAYASKKAGNVPVGGKLVGGRQATKAQLKARLMHR